MKRPILAIVLVLFAILVGAQQASPEHVAAEKFKAYDHLVGTYFNKINKENRIDTLFTILEEIETEARTQGNTEWQAFAKHKRLHALSNTRQYERVIADAPATLKQIAELKSWRHYYDTYSTLSTAYRMIGNSDKALETAQHMYAFASEQQNSAGMGLAFLAMARAYSTQRRFDEQEKCLREAITLLQDSTSYLNNLASIYYNLGVCLIAQQRYEDALEIAIEGEEINRRYEEVSKSKQTSAWLNTYMLYIDLYRQWKQFDKAEAYLNKFDSITDGRVPMYSERAHILYGKGKYPEAIEMINKRLEVAPNSRQALDMKMYILAAMHHNEEGYQLHRKIVALVDSINNNTFTTQLDELRTQYEVNRHIAEKTRNRNYYLLAFALCILLILLLGVAVFYNRAIAAKNRRLYQQIKEKDALMERAQLDVAQPITPLQGRDDQRPEGADLVDRLHQYLLTGDNLTRENLTRDDIIADLGTNRNILGDAVKAATGKTIMDYIRSMQIEEARRQLDNQPDLTMEVIAMNCGLSINTFYRLFKKYYGMSPAEYRRLGQRP